MTNYRRALALVPLLLLAAPTLLAAAEEPFTRSYKLQFLSGQRAAILIGNECPPEVHDKCHVVESNPNNVWVYADTETHVHLARLLDAKDVPPPTRVFRLILLVAKREGTSSIEGIGEGAQQALQDVQEILPFRAFDLVDTALMRSTLRATALVSGPEGREYEARIRIEGGVEEGSRKIFVQAFDLVELRKLAVETGDEFEAIKAITVLSSSFGLEIGETVVVGTSKLDGADKALLVLLTAIS